MLKKPVAVIMLCAILFMPGSARGASAQVSEAQAQAERDVNGNLWLGAGCLLGVVGYAIAYFGSPQPPASVLLGKPADYVVLYTEAYKERARKIQTGKALIGCLIGTAAQVLVYAVLIAANDSIYDY